MLEFFSEATVKGRKLHRCDACHTPIVKGEFHVSMSGKFDGDFFTTRNHLDCRQVECELANIHGLSGGEEWLHLHDLEQDDRKWLWQRHNNTWQRLAHIYGRYPK